MLLSETDFNQYVEDVFSYYKSNGYPHYPIDPEYRQKEFDKLKRVDIDRLYKDGIISQHMAGLALCWSYMTHAVKVSCDGKRTPFDAFYDDDIFRKVILKRIKYGDGITDAGIRKTLKVYTGTQSVSNFRPTAACAIYNKYANNGDIWDMSGGYGGRLMGYIISNSRSYIATEPCGESFEKLIDMLFDFGEGKHIEIYKEGSEVYQPDKNSLDLCFTSPPYFNTEAYSTEETQSYIKFPTKESWREGFYKQTMRNCYHGLRSDGKMIINTANVRTYKDLVDDTIKCAEEVGFKLIGVDKMALSKMFGTKLKDGDGFKYEPILIFDKK